MKKILLLLFLMALPVQTYSWQQVIVEQSYEEEVMPGAVRDRALQTGFRQAVSQEVDRIIPGWLPEERKVALMRHIDDSVDGLVQGYRQISSMEDDGVLYLEMEINVDTQSLRALLKKTGAYYTSDQSWPYDLNTRGASPEDFSLLRELQLITGAVVDGNATTRLSLGKSADGLWNGNIVHEDINMTASGKDLSRIWFDLWEYFFSRPEIMSIFVKGLTLDTSGWSSTDAIMSFDRNLGSWDREIEYRKILSVQSTPDALRATWKIRSLSPEMLLERLDNYLSIWEIDYTTGQ